jgi:hypothetical protein
MYSTPQSGKASISKSSYSYKPKVFKTAFAPNQTVDVWYDNFVIGSICRYYVNDRKLSDWIENKYALHQFCFFIVRRHVVSRFESPLLSFAISYSHRKIYVIT